MSGARRCKSCGAAIRWARAAGSGKWLPLDAEPAEQGDVYLDETGAAVILRGAELAEGRRAGLRLYRTHWASCPQARQWRKQEAGRA